MEGLAKAQDLAAQGVAPPTHLSAGPQGVDGAVLPDPTPGRPAHARARTQSAAAGLLQARKSPQRMQGPYWWMDSARGRPPVPAGRPSCHMRRRRGRSDG